MFITSFFYISIFKKNTIRVLVFLPPGPQPVAAGEGGCSGYVETGADSYIMTSIGRRGGDVGRNERRGTARLDR